QRHGWRLVHTSGQKEFWQRPGKTGRDWSATFNFIPNKFYVFSSNAFPFEPERAYDKFSVYALLEHNGDFSRAAKALAELGYHGNGSSRLYKKTEKHAVELPEDLPPLTQIGNAVRFCKMYEGKLKFNHTTKEWFIWDGTRWRTDTKDNIRLLGKDISQTILDDEPRYIEAGYDAKTVHAWFKSSQSLQNIDASLKLAACEPMFATTHTDWDRDLFLVNFKNGTLNLHTLEFYTNRPSDMITKLIPFDYDPTAHSRLWIDSLNMYFGGNQELIDFVQKVCGLSLCGAHLEEIIVFLYGTGANGKSIFVNTLRCVFGEYASLLPVEALITQRFDDAKKAEIASLVGARFVVTTEIPLNKHLNEATVKMLTGGDAVKVRNLYQNFFTFEPTFILWIFGNHKPDIRGVDNGIWRRMTLIPFEHTIPKEKRLPQSIIMDKLRNEASGIISWIVEGWKKYCDEGLHRPKAVIAATENYKDNQDPLSGFFSNMIISNADNKIKGT
ncbi:MAG: phage/plasmid primase, P4 family, partial [candidate division WOR-3 bacterium]|nr:phage/plasmid primase, P4 family [candidate division WOR-3 bacterium]